MAIVATLTCLGINVVPALVLFSLSLSVAAMIWGGIVCSRQSTIGSGPPRTLLMALCREASGRRVVPCAKCRMLPDLWISPSVNAGNGYYLRCASCSNTGESQNFAKQAVESWNTIETRKIMAAESDEDPKMGCASPGPPRPIPKVKPRGEVDAGDTVTFNHGRTIVSMRVEGGTVHCDGIRMEGLPPVDSGRLRKPRPFLKPLREHWWQFRRPAIDEFEVWLFKKELACYKRSKRE